MLASTQRRRARQPMPLFRSLVLVVAGSLIGPEALADHDGEVDSLSYEPHAGYDPPPR